MNRRSVFVLCICLLMQIMTPPTHGFEPFYAWSRLKDLHRRYIEPRTTAPPRVYNYSDPIPDVYRDIYSNLPIGYSTYRPPFNYESYEYMKQFGAMINLEARKNLDINMDLNGLFYDVIGIVAPMKRQCGVTILDYTTYVEGKQYAAEVEKILARLTEVPAIYNGELNETMQEEKRNQRILHLSEMKAYFDVLRDSVPAMEEDEALYYIHHLGSPLIWTGFSFLVTLGIQKLSEVVSKLFVGYDENQEHYIDKIKQDMSWDENSAFVRQLRMSSKAPVLLAYINKFTGLMEQLRKEFSNSIKDAFDTLFIKNQVHRDFLADKTSNGTVFKALEYLFGPGFGDSVLGRVGYQMEKGLVATVIGMNSHAMKIELCYPIATAADEMQLIEVTPAGHFEDHAHSTRTFQYPISLRRLFAVPGHCDTVSCLIALNEHNCLTMGKVRLCEQVSGDATCPLEQAKRVSCAVSVNAVGDQFVIGRATTTGWVIATTAKNAALVATNGSATPFEIKQPVFHINLVPQSTLRIYGQLFPSRFALVNQEIKITTTGDVAVIPVVYPPSPIPGTQFYVDSLHNKGGYFVTATCTVFWLYFVFVIVKSLLQFICEKKKPRSSRK